MENWRLLAEAVGVTTFLGLHNSSKSQFDWSISVQVKRRMYCIVYDCDKNIAKFTGRPPMLMQRYSSTYLPLDIGDDELFGRVPPAPHLLDENGWSRRKGRSAIGLLRARSLLAQVSEGTLDIALQAPNDDQTQKLL